MVVSATDALAFADAPVFFPHEALALACAVPALAFTDRGPALPSPCPAVALADALAEWLDVAQL
jgi:hypothetical protein